MLTLWVFKNRTHRVTFPGRCEQMSAHPRQGTKPQPKKHFYQPGLTNEFIGATYQCMSESYFKSLIGSEATGCIIRQPLLAWAIAPQRCSPRASYAACRQQASTSIVPDSPAGSSVSSPEVISLLYALCRVLAFLNLEICLFPIC